MATKKSLPDGLRAKSGERTSASIEALHAALNDLRRESARPEHDGSRLTLAVLVERAGLGDKFFYGPKHKSTTRIVFEKHLDVINAGIAERASQAASKKIAVDEVDELTAARLEIQYLKDRFEKLARQYNLAFHRMRDLRRKLWDYENSGGGEG